MTKQTQEKSYTTWQGYGIRFPGETWEEVANRIGVNPLLPNSGQGTFNVSPLPIFDPESIKSLEKKVGTYKLNALQNFKRYSENETQFKVEIRIVPTEEKPLTPLSIYEKDKKIFYSTGRTKEELLADIAKYYSKTGKVEDLVELPKDMYDYGGLWKVFSSVKEMNGVLVLENYRDDGYCQPRSKKTIYLPEKNTLFFVSYLHRTNLSEPRLTDVRTLSYDEEREVIESMTEHNNLYSALALEELLGFQVRGQE